MIAKGSMLALLGFAASCNFDAAFKGYCENNTHCQPADSGSPPETVQARDSSDADDRSDTGNGGDAEDGSDAGNGGDAEDGSYGRDSGDANNGPPITPPRTCGPSNDCRGPNEICHPIGQVCMRTCGTSADCPPWLDACTEIRDPTGSTRPPKVCTCTAAKICNSYANGFTCNPSDNLCEPYCQNSQDCSGFRPPRVCDQMSGLCQISTSSCSGNADCTSAAQPRCDPVILQCFGCVSPSDCAGRADGFTQCSPTGACMSPS